MNDHALALFLAVAQAAAPPQIVLPKISETVTVSIVNVDVVVTDREGRHVRGLSAEDFTVTEDGKPQAITNFSEFAGDAPPVATADAGEVPPLSLVIFLDTGSIAATHRGRVFRALKDFLKQNLAPKDEVMLVSWNRRMKVEVMPTRDIEAISKAIDRVALQAPRSISLPMQPTLMTADAGGPGAIAARSMQQRRAAKMTALDVQQGVRALNAVLARMAGAGGRKALLLVSEGFTIRAADIDPDLMNLELENQALIESVARTANASGVTLYTVHAAGTVPVFSAADSSVAEATTRDEFATNSTTALRTMAALTGGVIASGSDDFKGAFARVAEDFKSYYSIGYRASSDRAGRERRVDVRARDARYTVRARKTFVERSPEMQIRDEVIANLFFPSRTNQLRIRARVGDVKPAARGDVTVSVDIAIPLPSLTLLPSEGKYVGGFFVFLAAGDATNGMSEVARRGHRISFDAADLDKAMGVAYIHTIDVQTAPGNRISIGVLDEISMTSGFASVNVPAKKR